MASRVKKNTLRKDKLPNLKICVDNVEEPSGPSSDSSEEGEITDDEQLICEEASPEVKPEVEEKMNTQEPARKLASPVQSDEEEALTADLDDLETFGVTKKPKNIFKSKKEDRFELGFDPMSKENLEKRAERARRFGIESKIKSVHYSDADINAVYKSLGVDGEAAISERGVRLDKIHLRGVENLNTQDVYAYFTLFAPSQVEWIDSSSCNVLWSDDGSAARAMLSMSYDPNEAKTHKGPTDTGTDRLKPPPGTAAKKDEHAEKTSQSEIMEADSDPDDLDLLSSDDEGSKGKSNRRKAKGGQTGFGATEQSMDTDDATQEKEQMSSHSEEATGNDAKNSDDDEIVAHVIQASRIMPPGRWRIGRPLPHNKYIYMRFATKADRKLSDEKGITQARGGYRGPRGGLPSRYVAARHAEVEAEARKILAARANQRQKEFFRRRKLRTAHSDDEDEEPEYADRRDVISWQQDERVHARLHGNRPNKRSYENQGVDYHGQRRGMGGRQMVQYDDGGMFDDEEEDYERYNARELPRPKARLEDIRIGRRGRRDSGSEGEMDMQAELDELLQHEIPEKRKMRMYADDEEDLIKRKRITAPEPDYHGERRRTDLRGRLGNRDHHGIAARLSDGRQARRRRTERMRRRARGSSPEAESDEEHEDFDMDRVKYEKLTIQVDPDDV